ncbi:hypothetical protein XI09_03820 [Bradyrhizobium sp. CCBAU 11386]|nr:hypothetical protein [Bradyrhizobium sp. CCBAU 11386]
MQIDTQRADTRSRARRPETVSFMGWNTHMPPEVRSIAHHRGGADRALDWRQHMKIVDEDGEIIATASDEHTLIGGHHRLAVAASLGKKLFWRDTGEPVKLDNFFKHYGSSLRHTA